MSENLVSLHIFVSVFISICVYIYIYIHSYIHELLIKTSSSESRPRKVELTRAFKKTRRLP